MWPVIFCALLKVNKNELTCQMSGRWLLWLPLRLSLFSKVGCSTWLSFWSHCILLQCSPHTCTSLCPRCKAQPRWLLYRKELVPTQMLSWAYRFLLLTCSMKAAQVLVCCLYRSWCWLYTPCFISKMARKTVKEETGCAYLHPLSSRSLAGKYSRRLRQI